VANLWVEFPQRDLRIPLRDWRPWPPTTPSACNPKSPSLEGCQSFWLKDRQGRLWFPNERGSPIGRSRRLKENAIRPPVVVEEVLTDGGQSRRLELLAERATLKAGTEQVEFHYTALSSWNLRRSASKILAAGLRQGLDRRRNPPHGLITPIYPPGRYTFLGEGL